MYITLVDIFDTLHTSSSQEALNEKINWSFRRKRYSQSWKKYCCSNLGCPGKKNLVNLIMLHKIKFRFSKKVTKIPLFFYILEFEVLNVKFCSLLRNTLCMYFMNVAISQKNTYTSFSGMVLAWLRSRWFGKNPWNWACFNSLLSWSIATGLLLSGCQNGAPKTSCNSFCCW